MCRTPAWVWGLSLAACGIALGAEDRVVQRDADLRDGPGAYFESIGAVRRGETVSVGERKGGWSATRAKALNGWAPTPVFDRPRSGVDYLGIVDESNTVMISSVDITAATKGAFAARLGEKRVVQLAAADALDALRPDVSMVERIQRDLRGGRADGLVQSLPRADYRNTLGLEEAAEAELGKALAAYLITNNLVQDAKLLKYLNSVAAVLGEQTERYNVRYRVAVLDERGVNGFGLPGGYVILTRGLLAVLRDEAELACVIGHELAHISRYHGLREFKKREVHRRSDQIFGELDKAVGSKEPESAEAEMNRFVEDAQLKIIGGRARGDELEADVFGTAYAAAAGYDPKAAVAVLQRVRELGSEVDTYRHHPSPDDRIAEIDKAIVRYRMNRSGQVRSEARYREYTSGVAF